MVNSFMVFLPCSYRLQQIVPSINFPFYDPCDNIHNLEDLGMLDGIVDLQTIFAAGENPGSEHHVKVAGGIGLLLADGGENLADAALAIAEKIYNLQSGRLAQGFQDFSA